tara:strand:- start:120 stop:305 length:186 start_codon:yes stop_codon:yes gene_type:complete
MKLKLRNYKSVKKLNKKQKLYLISTFTIKEYEGQDSKYFLMKFVETLLAHNQAFPFPHWFI